MDKLIARDHYTMADAKMQPPVLSVSTPAELQALPVGALVDDSALYGKSDESFAAMREAALHYADVLKDVVPTYDMLDGGEPWLAVPGKAVDGLRSCGNRRISARLAADVTQSGAQYAPISGRYCRVPVCPISNARHAHKMSAKAFGALSYIQGERIECGLKPLQAVYIVLTVRNQSPRAMPAARLVLSKAMEYFADPAHNKRMSHLVENSIRTYECTLNTDYANPNKRGKRSKHEPLSPWFGTIHPHVNLLCLVPESYFHRGYITQAEIAADWKDCIVKACEYWRTHPPKVSAVWADYLFANTPEYDTAPNGAFDSFDPARYLGPNGEVIVSVQRVRDLKKCATAKGMDIGAGITEVVKYSLKSVDSIQLEERMAKVSSPAAARNLLLQVLLAYCAFFYDLRRVTFRGLWRKAMHAVGLNADNDDVSAEMLDMSAETAHVFGVGWNRAAKAYGLLGQYSGSQAVALLNMYLSGAANFDAFSSDSVPPVPFPRSAPDVSVGEFRRAYARNHPHRVGRKYSRKFTVELSTGRPGPADNPMADAVELLHAPPDEDIWTPEQMEF